MTNPVTQTDAIEPTGELSPIEVYPPHEVRERAKLDVLTAAMEADGWQGRPLLVLDEGVLRGWTGSHRIEAARAAGLRRVPVVLVDIDEISRANEALTGTEYAWLAEQYESDDLNDDADRLRWLEAAVEASGSESLATALTLMRAEIAANEAEGE
jgi:ParB-like chromosome segregation protein Spo0J